jgi:hypothetical protein
LSAWVAALVLGTLALLPAALGAPSLSVTPDTATVGDPVTLTIIAPDADPAGINWPELSNGVVGDLTLLYVDTLSDRRSQSDLGGPALRLTTAAFDTGSFSTGPLWLAIDGDTTRFPERTVTIMSVLQDTTNQFAPFKAQEDLPLTLNDMVKLFGPWIAGAGILLLLWTILARILRARRRAKMIPDEEIPAMSPYDEAKAALADLRASNPLAKGDQKAYVSGLAQIAKRLLERTHRAPVLEMTTWEVNRWLSQTSVLFAQKDLMTILDAGDTVKFARGALAAETAHDLIAATERIIEAYKPRPVTNDTTENGNGKNSSVHNNMRENGVTEVEAAGSSEKKQREWRMHTARSGANRGRRS